MYYLGDCDPHGADIYFQYLFGNQHNYAEEDGLAVPTIEWIGPFINDFEDVHTMKFSCCDSLKLTTVLAKPFF